MTKASCLSRGLFLSSFLIGSCSSEPSPLTGGYVTTVGGTGDSGENNTSTGTSGGVSVATNSAGVLVTSGTSNATTTAEGGSAETSGASTSGSGSASTTDGTAGTAASTVTGGTSLGGDTTLGGSATGSAAGGANGGQTVTAGLSATGAVSTTTSGATPLQCAGSDWGPGDQTLTLMHDGIERRYEVHIPPGYTGTTAVPLMLVIHGAHNTPQMARSWSKMDAVADKNGFIIAYPAGVDCWNAGSILPGCTAADDDLGFLLSVVDDVSNHTCIDPKRVFASGISNGAMMAQYLGCQAADVFAAVAGVAGPGGRCTPSRPITVVYFHGTADTTVGFSSAESTFTGWASRDDCTGEPVETYNQGSTVCRTYQNCNEGVEVAFCAITGMGHCWPEDTNCAPQRGAGVSDFEASPMMWSYFSRHPLP